MAFYFIELNFCCVNVWMHDVSYGLFTPVFKGHSIGGNVVLLFFE